MELSVLICHKKERKNLLKRLKLNILYSAIRSSKNLDYVFENLSDEYFTLPISKEYNAEFIIDDTDDITIGEKRNNLIERSKGKYITFIDDDDLISSNYFIHLSNAISKGVDVCQIVGKYYKNNEFISDFVHSIKYNYYGEENNVLVRPPNHLNMIKKELINDIKFENKFYNEDTEWALKISNLGILKTEYEVNEVMYFYEKIVDTNNIGYGVRFN